MRPAHAKPVPTWLIGMAGLLSLAVAMGVGRFVFTPMLPLMIQDGELDVARGGWLAAANYVGYLAGALCAGRLPLSARRLAVLALLLTAALTAAMALPLGAVGWAAVRLAGGMASAWAFVATSSWCLQALSQRAVADGGAVTWASLIYAGVGTGAAISGLHCLLAASAGVQAPSLWLQLGALALALGLPAFAVIRAIGAGPPGVVQPAAARFAAQQGTARHAPMPAAAIVVSYGVFGFGYILPATFLPAMARELVPDPRWFGLAWPVFGLTAAASAVVAGWLLRHVRRVRLWAASHVLMGIGTLLPSMSRNAWTIGLSALLVGGTFMVATLAGVQEARARVAAVGGDPVPALARMTTAFALGQIAGPVASSLLLHGGAGAQQALDLALQLGAVTLFATAAWLWRFSGRQAEAAAA